MKVQGIASAIVGLIGFATFTYLLIAGYIQTAGYCSLLALLALVCIVIPVLGRLKEFDLKNLRLILNKIEEVKKEIYAKEEDLKETSLLLSELIAANTTVTGIWGDKETKEYSDALIKTKIKSLGKKLNFDPDQIDSIFKYENALKRVHEASKEEHDEKWQEFKDLLKAESEKIS